MLILSFLIYHFNIFKNFLGFFEVNGDRQMCRSTTINAFFSSKSISFLSVVLAWKHVKNTSHAMVATQAASTKGVQNFYKVEFHFSIYPISKYILDFVTPCLKFRLQLATEKGFIIHKSFGPIVMFYFNLWCFLDIVVWSQTQLCNIHTDVWSYDGKIVTHMY